MRRPVTTSSEFDQILEWYTNRGREEATIIRLVREYLGHLDEADIPQQYSKRFSTYEFPCVNLDDVTVGWVDFWVHPEGGYHLVHYRRNRNL